jgi:hypothetical protein
MTSVPPELLQALQDAGGEPLRIVDPRTKEVYVVVKEAVFERVQRLLEDDPEKLYPLLADLSPEDWEDSSSYVPPPV